MSPHGSQQVQPRFNQFNFTENRFSRRALPQRRANHGENRASTSTTMAPNPAEFPSGKAPPSTIEFEPPLACVRRILKHSLPEATNVGKDASTAFCRACGIFIIYLTACANDFARESKRQTITANDVLAAIKELEFGSFVPDMQACLDSYRQAEKSKKDAKAAAAAAKAAAVATTDGAVEGEEASESGAGKDGVKGDADEETLKKDDAKESTPKVDSEKRPREEVETTSAVAEDEAESDAKRQKTDEDAASTQQ